MDVLSSLLGSQKQKFIYTSEASCLLATVTKEKKSTLSLSDLEELTNNPFKENAYFDAPILKKIAKSKNVICVVAPLSRFMYKAKLEAKTKSKGIQGLIPLLKERFNADLKTNQIAAIDAFTGIEIRDSANTALPDHVCFIGVQKQEIKMIQNELMDCQCIPKKLLLTTLTTAKGIIDYTKLVKVTQPVLFIDFSVNQSLVFVLCNNHIEAAYPPVHGLKSLISLTRKACSLPDDVSTYKYLLQSMTEDTQAMETITQRMCADIKSYIDFFEVQTSLPIEFLFINGLSPQLAWLTQCISKVLEIKPLQMDFNAWLQAHKVTMQNNEKMTQISQPLWIGMLSAIFNYFR
jgi:hypothetical protein